LPPVALGGAAAVIAADLGAWQPRIRCDPNPRQGNRDSFASGDTVAESREPDSAVADEHPL
jgi:hypothetical protein